MDESVEGNHRGAQAAFFVGALCFCWLLIWFFSQCRPFQRREATSAFPHPFPFCVSPKTERPCLEVLSDQKNKSKWHVTRKQCLDVPGQSKWPHLLRAISLLPAVCHLRWEGPGSEGRAEMVASASRSTWHGREGTGGLALAGGTQSSQRLHKRRLSVTHQDSDASSLSHGVHTFSAGQECQHVMKGLIHGGRQRRRSWSSSRYDPDWCWWGSSEMGAIIKCPCAFIKSLSRSRIHPLSSRARSLSLWPACYWYRSSSLLTGVHFDRNDMKLKQSKKDLKKNIYCQKYSMDFFFFFF